MTEKITSTTNETVKNTVKLHQKKYRDELNLFLAEGFKAIEGILKAGFEPEMLFIEEHKEEDFLQFDCPKTIVTQSVIEKMSTTKSPCSAILLAKQKKIKIKDLQNKKSLVLLENIKDAGNLGTILRSCKAFDVDGLLLLGDTIDLYNPKVIRASVGCFDLHVLNIDYQDLKVFQNYTIYSTALYDSAKPLKSVKFIKPAILAFGAESDGLSNKFLNFSKQNINIETSTCVESLNLASAVSICLYEFYIQTI